MSIENVHHAEHMRGSGRFADRNRPAIDRIARILRAGRETGAFRREIEAVDLHMVISSHCVFQVANRHTWAARLDRDLLDAGPRARHRTMLGDLVVEYLTSERT